MGQTSIPPVIPASFCENRRKIKIIGDDFPNIFNYSFSVLEAYVVMLGVPIDGTIG